MWKKVDSRLCKAQVLEKVYLDRNVSDYSMGQANTNTKKPSEKSPMKLFAAPQGGTSAMVQADKSAIIPADKSKGG